ncbi:hypothetical protein FOXYSP1_16589 [Fusarium oxysporum f. sp. phaseoli]
MIKWRTCLSKAVHRPMASKAACKLPTIQVGICCTAGRKPGSSAG